MGMKDKKNLVIGILAIAALVFAVLFFITNGDKGKLSDINAGLTNQVKSLSTEKQNLETQAEGLKAEMAQAAENAKAELDKAVGEASAATQAGEQKAAELQAQVDEAVKAGEDAKAALQTQLDEAVKAKEEAETALQTALAQAVEPTPEKTGLGEIDYAAVFPSWNPDSASLKELVNFVAAAVDVTGEGYIPAADRIAVFDMDGTIICEKAPVYVDYCMTLYRVLDDPAFTPTEDERISIQSIRDHANTYGETYKPANGITKDVMVAKAFEGMTPAEFRAYVVNFIDNTEVVGFSGMTYAQSFFKPMLEVMDFLRANDFDVWMVSASEREVVRAIVERLGIPFDHVVGTDVPYVASGSEGIKADEYNMTQKDVIVLGAPLAEVEVGKSGKPAAIDREIGKRPVLAFGNSSGDYSMLNYAESNPNYKGMGMFIVCDDTVREYGSDEKAAGFYAEAEKEDWTAISMANDWATIYGEGVEKTSLPGAETEEEALPDAA